MVKRPTDYTPQMQSIEEERRLRKIRDAEEKQREEALLILQAQSYGGLVLDLFERGPTIDMFAGLLRENLERLRANPELEKEWTARGAEFFRPTAPRKPTPGNKGATGNGDSRNGHVPHADARHGDPQTGEPPARTPALQPLPARAPAPRATPDLLNGLAADRSSQGTPAEGGSHGEHP